MLRIIAQREGTAVRLRWTAGAGKTFRVWTSSDLAAWTEVNGPLITESAANYEWLDDGSQSGGAPALRFYRLSL